jgi:hypothetical protein
MRLRVSDPSLVPELAEFLRRAGLTVGQEATDTLRITAQPLSAPGDDAADRARIVGEVRGWLLLHHGARVDFLPV